MCPRASRARSSWVAQLSSSSSRAALARAEGGIAGAVFVSGESGIGKTRLLRELEDRAADRGVRTMRGECPAFGAGELAYAPIASALRRLERELEPAAFEALVGPARGELARLVPEWASAAAQSDPTASGDAFAQARLFGRLRGLLDQLAADAPLLVAVEDLHWADRSTLELLSSLLRGLRDERVLLVCTYRSDELHRRHPLRPFVSEEERREGVQRVELEPFSPAELAAQVAGHPRRRRRSRARRAAARALRGQRVLRRGAAGRLWRRGRPAAFHPPRAPGAAAGGRAARRARGAARGRRRRRAGRPSAARHRHRPARAGAARCAARRRDPPRARRTTATATPSATPCWRRRPTPTCSRESGPRCTWRSPRP